MERHKNESLKQTQNFYDVYWIQTKQNTDRQAKYIYIENDVLV